MEAKVCREEISLEEFLNVKRNEFLGKFLAHVTDLLRLKWASRASRPLLDGVIFGLPHLTRGASDVISTRDSNSWCELLALATPGSGHPGPGHPGPGHPGLATLVWRSSMCGLA